VLEFSATDTLDLNFVKAAANLRAALYGIKGTDEDTVVVAALANVIVPDFVPAEGVKIAVTEAEAKEQVRVQRL
jgi:ubiquitin-activating enzyme E1